MPMTSVGRIVHYVSFGTPGGEYPSVCRASIVSATHTPEASTVCLVVLNPEGMFFNTAVSHHAGDPAEDARGARCNVGDRAYPGGTWHEPERI